MSRSGIGRGVHSFSSFIQPFLCRPRRRPRSNVAMKDGFGAAVMARDTSETCEFPSLDSCRKWFCGSTRKLMVSLRTQSSVLCSKKEVRRRFLKHLVPKTCHGFLFSRSQQAVSR